VRQDARPLDLRGALPQDRKSYLRDGKWRMWRTAPVQRRRVTQTHSQAPLTSARRRGSGP
jgi:hypothetical protein